MSAYDGPALYADALLQVWRSDDARGLRLVGQVDLTNQAAVLGHLLDLLDRQKADRSCSDAPAADLTADPAVDLTADPAVDLTVDLTEVTFLSFAALHTLVAFAEVLDPGRRLVLLARDLAIAEMLAACGWDRPEVPLTLLEETPDD
ncbi:hypothetical protein GCM10009801_48730 [Streptomyces albiaxialis]|uniref:STAS domain-containing protein n=1 Tax=Streptomyces albiaxialis TaxID=329523 RepID=A0ABP5HVH5_9ACTN